MASQSSAPKTLRLKSNFPRRTEVQKLLAEQRAAIAGAAKAEVDSFLGVRNRFIARRLLAGVESFQDPQVGMDIWKEYHRTGDDAALRQRIEGADMKSGNIARLVNVGVAENQALDGKGDRPVVRRFMAVAETVVRSTILRELESIDSSLQPVFAAFRSSRDWVSPRYGEMEPVRVALHRQLEAAFEHSLLGTFEDLRNAADKPLVNIDPDTAERLVDAVRNQQLQRFDRVSVQSFPATKRTSARREVELDHRQIPAGAKFGIEMEGHLPTDSDAPVQIRDVTSMLMALGLPCTIPFGLPKIDQKYNKWSVVFDTSVINPLRAVGGEDVKSKVARSGIEVVSPILEGVKGALDAKFVLSTLQLALRTNESCGFHIHCDLADASLVEVKNLATAFVRNEAKLDQFIHPDRRGENAVFAASVAEVSLEEIQAAQTLPELVEVMNHGNRNSKFDITGLDNPRAPQTVQYRAEGGAEYLENAFSYTLFMVNFTAAARLNPDLDVDVLARTLAAERPQSRDAGSFNAGTDTAQGPLRLATRETASGLPPKGMTFQ